MASSLVLPRSLNPGDIYYLSDNSMILCVSQSPNSAPSDAAAVAAAAAAATATVGHHQQHYKSRSASGTPANPHSIWTPQSLSIGPAPDLGGASAGYFPAEYAGVGHPGAAAVTMATLQPASEPTAAMHQVPLFSNGYVLQPSYMVSLQEQDSLVFSMPQESIDQHQQQQQHYGYHYGYPQHAAVMPAHQPAAYGVYPSQHQQHHHHHHHHQQQQQQSQQSPPGGMDGAYPNVTSSAAAYMNQASLDGSESLQSQQQQQQQSPIESSDGKSEQQQQQQQQRRPKQHNTNQALEQISKLMLKLGDEEQISAEERQDRIRRYTDIALTIPVVWNYVCQLSELKHEAELGKVYGFLHHLAECSVSADEWKQAIVEKSCVFSVFDGRLRQKVCPILRVQGRSPEKIETLCDDIKQKPSQRYRVQAKHVLEQLHEFFCSFLPAELPQLTPPEQLVVDHASVLVIYPDTDSFERVNSLLHKLAFTKLCLGPDAADAADAAAASAADSDDPVDAAKRKWEAQLRPCSCPRALSLYAVPGKWQAYPLVADSQWELTRAEIGMSTTLSIKAAAPAASEPASAETVNQLSDATAAIALSPVATSVGIPAGAEAAAATAHFTGSPILAPHDPAYQVCGLMDSAAGPANPPPVQQPIPAPQPPPPNRGFKQPHQHQYPQHGQGGYPSYPMPNRRHGPDRQTMPPRFARHAAYHDAHDGPVGGLGSGAGHHHQMHRATQSAAPLQPAPPPPPPPPQHHQQQQQQQHHQPHHHQDYRHSGPPSRSAIGHRGRGYGRGGFRGGSSGRDYQHSNHAAQGPAEFRLKENDFPEISADAAAGTSGNGGLASQGHNNSAQSAASSTHAAAASAASVGDSSSDSATVGSGASPEQSQQAGGASGTSYAAALKKSVPPGSSKIAVVSAANANAASTGDAAAAEVPASPTSPSPAVRRAVASAAAASSEASSDATERDSALPAGYHRGGGGGGNAWKTAPTVASGHQRQSVNGTAARGSRNVSGGNA